MLVGATIYTGTHMPMAQHQGQITGRQLGQGHFDTQTGSKRIKPLTLQWPGIILLSNRWTTNFPYT